MNSGSSTRMTNPAAFDGCETLRIVGFQLDGNVDVGAQTGHPVRDDCLSAEHVPAPPVGEHLGQCGQEFNCGGGKHA